MGGRFVAQRGRRVFAVVACLLWLLGVEVLPNLHLAFHDDDHTHAAGVIVVARVTLEDHDHTGAAAHQHDDAHHSELAKPGHEKVDIEDPVDERPKRRRVDQLAFDLERSGHAAAGLAHHALALLDPPPPVLAPIAVDRQIVRAVTTLADRLPTTTVARVNARGPPPIAG